MLIPMRQFCMGQGECNFGDAHVFFFDPLGSSVSMLSSNNQLLALHNGCQEVVSKGGLDRFVRLSWSSITLTFNTLEANIKNQQLSRGSKPLNARQYVTGKMFMKSQTSARRIKNSISALLYRGAENFNLRGLFGRPRAVIIVEISQLATRCVHSSIFVAYPCCRPPVRRPHLPYKMAFQHYQSHSLLTDKCGLSDK